MPVGGGLSEWELVERDELLGDLARWTDEARSAQGRIVLISGEAGVGKTELLRRWRSLVSDSVQWNQGACESLISPRPAAPFLQMAAIDDDEVVRAVEEVGSRGALFSAVRGRLTCPDVPTIVAVEDAHWADEVSLDLLWHLARRVQDAPVVLAVTFRDDESAASEHFPTLLGELSRLPGAARVDLRPLSRDGVARLVDGSGLDVDQLVRLTGGNPYYVTELVMSGPATIPPSVRDAIIGRVARLSELAREGAFLMAQVGQTMPPQLLEQLFGDDTEDLVDELVAAGLWTDDRTGPGFRHELTRQVVADTGTARRRVVANRRILSALEVLGSQEWARLAHHAAGAHDDAALLRYARLAGVTAAQVGSMREAAVHLEAALAACPEGDLEQEAFLVGELAEVRALRKEYQLAIALRARERRLWASRGDMDRAAVADLRSVWVHNTAYCFDDALRVGQAALDQLAASEDHTLQARAHGVLARLFMLHDRVDDAMQETARARASDPQWADEDSDLLNTEACCLWMDDREWRPTMDRALDIARARGDAPPVARVLYNTVDLLRCDVRLPEALVAVEEALAHTWAHGLTTYHFHLELHRAAILERLGRWSEALELATTHLRWGDDGEVRAMPAQVVAVVSARRGLPPPEDRLLDSALIQAEPSEQPQNIVPVRLARAEVAWLAGDEGTARTEVESARNLATGSAHLHRESELWASRCGMDAVAERLDGPAADEVSGRRLEAARGWRSLGAPYDAAWALLGSEEEEHLVTALREFEALDAAVPAGRARQRLRSLGFTPPAAPRRSTRDHPRGLTVREQEILALLADGLRNRDIAERLFIGERTVATHVSSLMRKLEVTSRSAAAAWFRAGP